MTRPCSLALFLALLGGAGFGQDLTIAAAADLQFVMKDVASRFEKSSGQRVNLIFGSSGNFFAQAQNGAPFDVFLSADLDYPKKLEAAGLAEPGTVYLYATGKIAMWVPADSKLDLSKGLAVLKDPAIKKIAIANPEHAPYGRAAVAALRHENLYDAVSSKFVLGENIAQTAEFVASGSADIGIVALSLAMAPAMKDKGRYVEIPSEDYPPIQQAAVVLKSSTHKELAGQFIKFTKTAEIVDLLGRSGFSKPVQSSH